MANGTTISVFNIPELLEMIFQFLTPHEMAMTMATCKDLSRELTPILWKNVIIKRYSPMKINLIRNRHYIRTIFASNLREIDFEALFTGLQGRALISAASGQGKSVSLSKSLSNLTQITLRDFRFIYSNCSTELLLAFDNSRLFTAFKLCTNLTHLEFPCTDILAFRTLAVQLNELLYNDLQYLVYLKLTGDSATLQTALPLLLACFLHLYLEELYISFEIKNPDPSESGYFEELCPRFRSIMNYLGKAIKSESSASKISSLTLPVYLSGFPVKFLVPLLNRFLPNIVHLNIPVVEMPHTMNSGENIVAVCPKLQHMTCPLFGRARFMATTVKNFIISCSKGVGLKTFKASRFVNMDSPHETTGVIEALIEYHSRTIEEIELLDCLRIASEVLQSVLTTCRNLRRFLVSPGPHNFISRAALQFKDIVTKPWVCLDLKELHLHLFRGHPHEGDVAPIAKKVYSQIGRLVKLETLRIGYSIDDYIYRQEDIEDLGMDLTLKHGWLAELKGLVELRHFYIAPYFGVNMGQAEVEFIHSNWPHLERITFDTRQGNIFQPNSHWEWLQQQRPKLRYS
ncbi:hypothetical protein BGX27_010834 [Mortierella sp. AM989]|nr:hypothetical protein BGX27_010834 [Mortierella sp. AM989]